MATSKTTSKTLALAAGAALAGGFGAAGASAAETGASPFAMTILGGGYMLGAGEGGCGGDKEGGKAGKDKAEGSCGGKKDKDKDAEGSCGGDKEGEGSCGAAA